MTNVTMTTTYTLHIPVPDLIRYLTTDQKCPGLGDNLPSNVSRITELIDDDDAGYQVAIISWVSPTKAIT